MFYKARSGVAHKLTGPNLVAHAANCGCDFVRTVSYANWITYNMMDGIVLCSRCGKTEFLPTPHVKMNRFDMDCKEVYMDHEAIADELNAFKVGHHDCKEPLKSEAELDPITHD